MKTVFFALIIGLVCWSGFSFTFQTLHPTTIAAAGNGAAAIPHITAPPLQIQQLPVTEPVYIVLSSLLLLGATTLLRHHRRAPRGATSQETKGI